MCIYIYDVAIGEGPPRWDIYIQLYIWCMYIISINIAYLKYLISENLNIIVNVFMVLYIIFSIVYCILYFIVREEQSDLCVQYIGINVQI